MQLKNLLSAGALVAIGMVAGRLLGLLREMLLAAQFGAGSQADSAVLLLIIPDFITAALVGSAASAALVPAFANHVPSHAHKLFRQALAVSVAALFLVGLALLALKTPLGWDMPGDALALALLALPLSAATAVLTAWLQFRGRFLAPAFATALFNIVILLGLWLGGASLVALGAAIALAALARLAAHMLPAMRLHNPKASDNPGWLLTSDLRKTYVTAMGTGILGMLPVYMPYAVTLAGAASVAVMNYALKLVLMPAMLAQTVVQVAVLPWLVSMRKTHDEQALSRLHAQAVQFALLLGVVGALALAVCATDLAALCFGYGKMTPLDIHRVGRAFALGIFALPPMLLATLLQSMLYAATHARAQLAANVAQALAIVPAYALGQELGGLAGLLGAFALLQALPLPILWRAARRQGLLPLLKTMLLPMLAAFAAALACFAPVALWLPGQSFSPPVAIACAGLAGIVSLAAGAFTMRLCGKYHV